MRIYSNFNTRKKEPWYFFSIPIIATCLFFFHVESCIKFSLNSRALVEENEMFLMSMNQKKRGQNSISLVFKKRFQNTGGSELPARAEMFGSSLAVLFMSLLFDEVFNITFFDLCLCLSDNFSLWVLAISEVHLTLFWVLWVWKYKLLQKSSIYFTLAMRYSKSVKAMSIFTPNLGIDWLACTMEALTEIYSQALQRSPISFFLFLNLFWSQKQSRYYRLIQIPWCPGHQSF